MPEKILTASSGPAPLARGAVVIEPIALAIAVLATLLLVGTLLWRSHLGFDFTDEGYYLNSISNPWRYPVSQSQFGYVYHPLYLLLGRDIALLRQGNILISFCLAVLACLCLLRSIARETSTGRPWLSVSSIGTSVVTASSAVLVVFVMSERWLPTPSYNSLTFQSLLIASIGYCLAEAKPSPVSVVGWILIGIGGGLVFLAKPTSAAALSVAMLCSLTIAGRLNRQMLVISVSSSLLLLSLLAWAIDGSIIKFVRDLYQSAVNLGLLSGDYHAAGIFRRDPLNLQTDDLRILVALTALVVSLIWLTYSERRGWSIAGAVVILACAGIDLALALGLLQPEVPQTKYLGLQFLALIFAALLSVASVSRKFGSPVSGGGLSRGLFFAVLPFVYAFGSNNNYWLASQSAAFFWTLSGISMIASARPETDMWRRLSPLAVVTLAMTAVLVHHGMKFPYRQTKPLTADADAIQIAETGARLLVGHDFSVYIHATLRLSRDAGFKTGTPMVDLSGHYPGMLYVMGARPVGVPWLSGGYPGSDAFAEKILDGVSCGELAESWILTEPNGPRKLSPAILKKYGIDMERDYTIVAVLDSPTGTYPDSYQQQLRKPTRAQQDSISACESARRGKG